jgi:hypothetical protein
MHVHLVNFQVLNRQPFDAPAYEAAYEAWVNGGREPANKPVLANHLTGPPVPPDPEEEMAYKDTVKSYPGTVTRVIQTFEVPGTIASIPGSGAELPATWIHHCHILEHEDDDKMRPWAIVRRGHGRHRRVRSTRLIPAPMTSGGWRVARSVPVRAYGAWAGTRSVGHFAVGRTLRGPSGTSRAVGHLASRRRSVPLWASRIPWLK